MDKRSLSWVFVHKLWRKLKSLRFSWEEGSEFIFLLKVKTDRGMIPLIVMWTIIALQQLMLMSWWTTINVIVVTNCFEFKFAPVSSKFGSRPTPTASCCFSSADAAWASPRLLAWDNNKNNNNGAVFLVYLCCTLLQQQFTFEQRSIKKCRGLHQWCNNTNMWRRSIALHFYTYAYLLTCNLHV